MEEFRSRLRVDLRSFDAYISQHNSVSHFAHFYLHASGLFYGYAKQRQFCLFADADTWNEADHFKISLIEGFFLTYFIHQKERYSSVQDGSYESLIRECLQKIFDFYVLFTMTDSQSVKYRNLFIHSSSIQKTVEEVFDNRVNNPSMLRLDFWKGSQFNIFSGLDLMYFALWLEGDYAYDRRTQLHDCIIRLMTIACEKESIRNNGKALVAYFISSGNYDAKDFAGKYSIDFEKYNASEKNVVRRLLYEYAVYTCLIDNSLSVSEVLLLQEISRSFKLDEDKAQQSLITIENFLLLYGDKIFFLQYGEGLDVIKKAFFNRSYAFIQKNKTKIVTEIMESKELVELLRKSRRNDLSEMEKAKVREQILDVLKTIPSLAIFMIPGGAILLPILFKILPEELIKPSSFINKSSSDA